MCLGGKVLKVSFVNPLPSRYYGWPLTLWIDLTAMIKLNFLPHPWTIGLAGRLFGMLTLHFFTEILLEGASPD